MGEDPSEAGKLRWASLADSPPIHPARVDELYDTAAQQMMDPSILRVVVGRARKAIRRLLKRMIDGAALSAISR